MDQSRDDSELWENIRRGDVQAFEWLYKRYAEGLRNFLRRYLRDPKAAEDTAQEVFLQLWKRPNGYRPERGRLKDYLFGMAAKRAADWRRHRTVPEMPFQEHPVVQGEMNLVIADAVDRLEPETRALLWLREVEGYSHAELSEILDIPVGTVKSRLYTAREKLRRIWEAADKLGGHHGMP